MNETTSGECFCGAIQYAIRGPLGKARSCHCSRCRKAFSGAGSTFLPASPPAFSWLRGSQEVATYMSEKGPGLGFCKTCGTTLCVFIHGEVMGVALGTLNGDPEVEIGEHIFVGSKATWDVIGGGAPQFEEFPTDDVELDAR